ncbi:MAG TPA: discoidin domain-containing protein, partial [Verrucomicrobiae bacterium]|nr:discoidin domain-containing protein [Verrucomicrobiae bacterium]
MTRFIGFFFVALAAVVATAAEIKITASSSQSGSEPGLAFDGDVFGTNRVWRGERGTSWFWEIDFGRIRKVGAVLQVLGEADYVLQHVPRRYHWLGSRNGAYWMPLSAAAVTNEQRLFRTIRFEQQHEIRFARLAIQEASGEYPAVREISF